VVIHRIIKLVMQKLFFTYVLSVTVTLLSGCATALAVADATVSTAVTVTSTVVNTGIKATGAVVDAVIPSKK
jgi:uncharacterized protein YceK